MTVTVTSDLTDISACNSTTDSGTHLRLSGTSSGNPAADADTYTQGTGCIANKMGTTAGVDVGGHFNRTSTFDITGKHLFHWRFIVTAGNMAAKANKGVTIGLTNTSTTSTSAWSTTNYKQWYLDGKDTLPLSPGWIPYVLDPTAAADASAGTLDLTTVKNVGYVCRQVSGVTATLSNQFVDAIRMGTGLTATASSAGDTISFATLYDQDKLTTNAWGVITANAGIYYGAAKMTIGAAGQANTCLFKDTNAVLVWREFPVDSSLYAFNLLGASGNITTFQLGNKDGDNNTSDGCVVRGQGTAVWNIVCGSNTAFKAYSSSLSRCLTATLSSISELRNTSVSSSGTFDVNGATIVGCQFASHTATQLKVDSTAEMALITSNSFASAATGHAIELTVPGAYSFAGIKFAGYGPGSDTGDVPLATDTFTRADGGLGANYTSAVGAGLLVSSNTCAGAQNEERGSLRTAESYAADQYVEFTLASESNSWVGAMLRTTGADSTRNGYMADAGANDTVYIARYVNGVGFNIVDGTTHAWSPGDRVRAEIIGYTINLYRNGVLVESGTDDLELFATGAPGLYTYSNATLDDAEFGNIFSESGGENAAVYNNSGGAVTINVSGGTSPTVRNGTGASTVVSAGSVTVDATVKTLAGAAIQNARVILTADAGGPFPSNVTITITNSGTTATVAHTAHGLATSDKVKIKSASLAANNGVFAITKIDANTYTYTMASSPGSNPTGTIKVWYVALEGLTDAGGLISASRVYASDQPISGWVRKSSAQPFYKTSLISGFVSSSAGFSTTVQMILDE